MTNKQLIKLFIMILGFIALLINAYSESKETRLFTFMPFIIYVILDFLNKI